MSDDNRTDKSAEDAAKEPNVSQGIETEAAIDVHLEDRLQRRNIALYVIKWCLVYFSAPVLYVGFIQASLCKRLGASDFVANLPSAAYLLLAAFPIIMAWAFPQVRHLRRVMTIGIALTGVMGGITAIVLCLPAPNWLRIGVVIAHAAIVACSWGTAWVFEWEFLGRGISESRRGLLFGSTCSIGPLFAVVGSLGAQLIINNEVFGWTPQFWREIPYPINYTVLYGATLPLMLLAALLVSFYSVPLPAVEVKRKPFLSGVLGGFGRFVSYRLMFIACVAYLLIYSATTIQNNMVLYTREAVGLPEDTFVGYQLALRFGGKIFAGLMLGWILKLANPRMNLFVTALFVIASIVWILAVEPLFGGGLLFLVAFGLSGAGELMGCYYPYYVLCLSPKSQMRRNMAFVMLLSAPVGFAPALFGFISDTWSLTASFWASLAIAAGTFILVGCLLPGRPRPRPEDFEPADLENELAGTPTSA